MLGLRLATMQQACNTAPKWCHCIHFSNLLSPVDLASVSTPPSVLSCRRQVLGLLSHHFADVAFRLLEYNLCSQSRLVCNSMNSVVSFKQHLTGKACRVPLRRARVTKQCNAREKSRSGMKMTDFGYIHYHSLYP